MTLNELYEKRNDFFIKDNLQLKLDICFRCSWTCRSVYGFITDPVRTQSVSMNNVFFFLISLGGVLLGGIQDTVELFGEDL